MWAIGASNTFDSHYPTTMKATAVALIPAPVYEHTVQLTDSLSVHTLAHPFFNQEIQ